MFCIRERKYTSHPEAARLCALLLTADVDGNNYLLLLLVQTKQYAQDREKAQMLEAEQQVVGRKFDALDEAGNGAIDREQASNKSSMKAMRLGIDNVYCRG